MLRLLRHRRQRREERIDAVRIPRHAVSLPRCLRVSPCELYFTAIRPTRRASCASTELTNPGKLRCRYPNVSARTRSFLPPWPEFPLDQIRQIIAQCAASGKLDISVAVAIEILLAIASAHVFAVRAGKCLRWRRSGIGHIWCKPDPHPRETSPRSAGLPAHKSRCGPSSAFAGPRPKPPSKIPALRPMTTSTLIPGSDRLS